MTFKFKDRSTPSKPTVIRKPKKRKGTYLRSSFTCPKCGSYNDIEVSGYGDHLRKCRLCGEQIMFHYEEPTRDYNKLSTEKIDKLPKDIRDKIYAEIEELKEKDANKLKEPKLTEIKNKYDENKSIITNKGQLIIAQMIKEGLNIATDDPEEDKRNKKRFAEIFTDITGLKLPKDINLEEV